MSFSTIDKNIFFICNNCEYFRLIKDENKEHIFCTKCGNEMNCNCRKCNLEFSDPFSIFCERCGEKIKEV